MSPEVRSFAASATAHVRGAPTTREPATAESVRMIGTPELSRALSEVKGQAQFLLYLADQVEDCLRQLADEADTGNAAFLCKLLSMYSSQLETKHQGLGEKIAETCQEVYVAIRGMELEE